MRRKDIFDGVGGIGDFALLDHARRAFERMGNAQQPRHDGAAVEAAKLWAAMEAKLELLMPEADPAFFLTLTDEQLRELKGGGIELKLKLSSLAEIERWVLSWGGDAKILQPRELAEAVIKSAKAILAQRG